MWCIVCAYWMESTDMRGIKKIKLWLNSKYQDYCGHADDKELMFSNERRKGVTFASSINLLLRQV